MRVFCIIVLDFCIDLSQSPRKLLHFLTKWALEFYYSTDLCYHIYRRNDADTPLFCPCALHCKGVVSSDLWPLHPNVFLGVFHASNRNDSMLMLILISNLSLPKANLGMYVVVLQVELVLFF